MNIFFQVIQRKEKEMAAIAAKIEDEQSLGTKMQKQIKELSVRNDNQMIENAKARNASLHNLNRFHLWKNASETTLVGAINLGSNLKPFSEAKTNCRKQYTQKMQSDFNAYH